MQAIIISAAFAAFTGFLGPTIYKEIIRAREHEKAKAENLYSIIKPALDNPAWHYILYRGITKGSGKTKLQVNEFSLQWILDALICLTENPQSTLSPESRDPDTVAVGVDTLKCAQVLKQALKYPDPHTSEEQRIALKIFLEGVFENYQTGTCTFRERYVASCWDPKGLVVCIEVEKLNQDIKCINKKLGLHLKPLYEEKRKPKKC